MSFSYFKKNKGPNTKNFYIALAVCVFAVGATVFTTYDSFVRYNNKKNNSKAQNSSKSSVQSQPNKEANNDVHGIIVDTEESSESGFQEETIADTDYDDNYDDSNKEIKTSAKKANDELAPIVFPCSKEVIKEFSFENPVYSKTMDDWRLHSGVDFKAEQGEKIKAITDGVVKNIYEDAMLGKTIEIEHQNNITAFYSGLGDTTLVNKDDTVKTGQEIGSINDIPSEISDGYHLHFAIKKDGKFINPLDVLPQ